MTAPSRSPRVLVTDVHLPAGLAAVRSLGRAGYRVTLAWPEDVRTPVACRSRHGADQVRYPDPWLSQDAFTDWLADALGAGRWDVVLPVDEAAILGAARLRRRLPDAAIYAVPPESFLRYALSHFHATRLAQRLGVRVPRTVFVSDGEGTQTWDEDFSAVAFPMRIKVDNYFDADGVYIRGYTRVAHEPRQAVALLRELTGLRAGILAQEEIRGDAYGAAFLRLEDGIRLRFTQRCLHEAPWHGGKPTLSASCRNARLLEKGEKLAVGLGLEGLALFDFRHSAADNRFHFVGLRGQPWDTLALALHCGVDFPRAWLDALIGEHPALSQPAWPDGRRCRNLLPGEWRHLASVFRERSAVGGRNPPSRLKATFAFAASLFNPFARNEQFWWSDPKPGLARGREALLALPRRLATGARDWHERRLNEQVLAGARRRHLQALERGIYFPQRPGRILFICLGNICRSPFAERYWNRLVVTRGREGPSAVSAGFIVPEGRTTPSRILRVIAPYELNLQHHRSRLVSAELIQAAGAVFVMDGANYRQLLNGFPQAIDKTYFLGLFADQGGGAIPDPIALGPDEAAAAYRQLADALDGLWRRLNPDRAENP